MNDPISFFYIKYGFDVNQIANLILGQKYCAVLLKNGNIGVAATLDNFIDLKIEDLQNPDLNNISYRIVLGACLNAQLNYSNNFEKTADIFDEVDFAKYQHISMIGFFDSLVQKFHKKNILLNVFDRLLESNELTPIELQNEHLEKSDSVIISGTSIFNGTFNQIVSATPVNCDIYLLGPSNILHDDYFMNPKLKIIFGSVFEKNDRRVLDIIKNGGGTKDFMQFMRKVYIRQGSQM